MQVQLELSESHRYAELFVSNMTQNNTLFVMHQSAHFMHKPMHVHENVVKCIVCYLNVTHMQGYIFILTVEKWLDHYINANFAGMWNPEDSDVLSSIKSQTG